MPIKKPVKSKKEVKKAPKKAVVKVKAVPKQEVIGLETKKVVEPIEIKKSTAKEKYYEAMGGRKESIARVSLYTKKATDEGGEEKALITVNGKDYREYFSDA